MGEWLRAAVRSGLTNMSYPFKQSFMRPLPSKATRKPPARSKASSRGHATCATASDPRLRLRYYESKREQDALYLLLARQDVVDIWDQPPPVPYRDEVGGFAATPLITGSR